MIYWRGFLILCLYTAFAFSDDECEVSVGGRRQFIQPGCQFCNGAAGEVSVWAECRNGQNRVQNCPKGQVCLGRGQCQIACGSKDDHGDGGDNGGDDSGEVVQCTVSVSGKRQLIPPECQFCNGDTDFATCRDGQNIITSCPHQTKCSTEIFSHHGVSKGRKNGSRLLLFRGLVQSVGALVATKTSENFFIHCLIVHFAPESCSVSITMRLSNIVCLSILGVMLIATSVCGQGRPQGTGNAPEFRGVANFAVVRNVAAGANVNVTARSIGTAADADNVAVRTGVAALTAIKAEIFNQ
ncbi:hypothetical protein Ddc_07376 [Ditylenchus destructor]|nr:hypothetical protein Ddc_07376 [Ditylenchus destructor]